MVSDPVTVNMTESMYDIIKKMESEKVSHLIVENDDKDLVGIISKQDLLQQTKIMMSITTGKTYTDLKIKNMSAGEIMTKDPIGLKKTDSVEYAVELLLQNEFHCLPVVENEKSIGIVTFYDLLKAYYQEFG